MARTIDLLTKAGLVSATLGKKGCASSTYSLTEAAHRLTAALGVSQASLILILPLERLVRVREGGKGTNQITIEGSSEALDWIADLEAYNVFLAAHDIGLSLTREEEREWTRQLNENGACSSPLTRPELFNKSLYRQFNNGHFNEGGRLYGGWWINVPRKLRSRITINGVPTTELDYSGCAIRMLYHERGLEYEDDAYLLPLVAQHENKSGLQSGYYRDAIKRITQALINDRDKRGQPERVALADGITFRPAFKRNSIRAMIEDKHALIADAFGTGAGLRLQRKDSDIALKVITTLMRKGILALPVHDSFIVDHSNLEDLRDAMRSMYEMELLHSPVIK